MKKFKKICAYWAYVGKCWIKFWLDFNFPSLRYGHFIKNYHFRSFWQQLTIFYDFVQLLKKKLMLAHVTMLFSSFAHRVCQLWEKSKFWHLPPDFFLKILIFLKNGKQGMQTVRLDELNNIVTWANISFIFKSWKKLSNIVNCGQKPLKW